MKFKGTERVDFFECGYCGKPIKKGIFCCKKCEDAFNEEKSLEKQKFKR
jgi:hypothetical protein